MKVTMRFGITAVGDVTPDPVTGRSPTERERIKAMAAIALKAEEVGLGVFAIGRARARPVTAAGCDLALALFDLRS